MNLIFITFCKVANLFFINKKEKIFIASGYDKRSIYVAKSYLFVNIHFVLQKSL